MSILEQARQDLSGHHLVDRVLDAEAPRDGRAGVVLVVGQSDMVCGWWLPGDNEWGLGIYGDPAARRAFHKRTGRWPQV